MHWCSQLLGSIGEDVQENEPVFPIMVIDEAAQTTEPALMCALAAAKAHQVILVGDTWNCDHSNCRTEKHNLCQSYGAIIEKWSH